MECVIDVALVGRLSKYKETDAGRCEQAKEYDEWERALVPMWAKRLVHRALGGEECEFLIRTVWPLTVHMLSALVRTASSHMRGTTEAWQSMHDSSGEGHRL